MNLGPDDRVVVITSAGCNALDYVLAGPGRVDAVDMNPRQNALLELKIAGIRRLDYPTFFEMFGHGWCKQADALYRPGSGPICAAARGATGTATSASSAPAVRRSFYFHGTAGSLAWMVKHYMDNVARIRPSITQLMDACTVAEQQAIYRAISPDLLEGFVRWAMDRDMTLAMLGVPRAARTAGRPHLSRRHRQVHGGSCRSGLHQAAVPRELFLARLLTGQYTPNCCPEYLKPDNFARLQQGQVERIGVHTAPCTIS